MDANHLTITPRCPIRTTLELVGGKWRLLVLHQLHPVPCRFSALKSRLPDISEKVLVQELRQLAQAGLVVRRAYGEVPPRVEYALTPLGEQALPLIGAIASFGQHYLSALLMETEAAPAAS
ncbi:transcriptional regulator, HxlR family [Hymenobacter daecheongensis DSM 21074]|uniref:Transcriptional regulator, HxlR family n=1 Tax=Hymenobacter daecheongensis DSM 21074 TaxID=1121955 RepID=A0A1M6GDJ0_9BACT|nr:helix-turn-helix domain-containing protein [Hymenobacter daecheongensis]SHJ08004.1 transcriptional regulator, HxlR family [Hymenobacter daecheongensis DSM 21074]